MAWIQPFLNWVAGMIPTKDDFNRIEGNTQYLKDEIDTQMAELEQNKVDKIAGKGLSTNDYTTTEKNKLAGIEAGATKDQTASEILTLLKTVDTNTSGLNANFLQGKAASAFFQATSDIFITGVYTGDKTPSRNITLGFKPKAVIVMGCGSMVFNYNSQAMGGLALDGYPAKNGANNADVEAVTINSTGFTVYYNPENKVYTNADNASYGGPQYNYIAIK
ncbi:hypothetical protein [Proteiniborus sp.]|uniref:hypothetical protein n=1 Tax=Proteiniborus sp. TaxID=2079015 RepID=UPI0033255020